MTKLFRRCVGVALVMALACAGSCPALADGEGVGPGDAVAPTVSVMTYNVEGLPFPVRSGRRKAAGRIAAQLAAMRAAGTQPHVVVLQEAFGAAQQSIGRKAGYDFTAFGPDRHARNDEPMTDDDRAFAAGARRARGEDDGKWAGSGLAILSDYPILSIRRMPFPAFACAGTDCLANKGVMLATVQVPGAAAPIAIVATHMNSRQASGAPPPRFTWAFMRQVKSIDAFLRANLPADMPYVFAGDTNIGRSTERAAAFRAMLAALPRAANDGVVRTALAACLDPDGACTIDQAREVRRAYAHGKDWQVYADGGDSGVSPIAVSAPFGHDARGRMLSDHIGYSALYRLSDRDAANRVGR